MGIYFFAHRMYFGHDDRSYFLFKKPSSREVSFTTEISFSKDFLQGDIIPFCTNGPPAGFDLRVLPKGVVLENTSQKQGICFLLASSGEICTLCLYRTNQ